MGRDNLSGKAASWIAPLRQPLLNYFLRRRLAPDVAEDCVQETFARLWRVNVDSIQSPDKYVFRVASSVAIDRARRARSHAEIAHSPIDSFDLISEEPSPARVFEGREAISRLAALLDELPPKTKDMFLLNRLEGLTYSQLARRYACTPSAVEKHMSKALAHIRNGLRDD